MKIDKEIEDKFKERNFNSFWECFDFLLTIGYNEIDSLLIGLDMFDGDMWSKVLFIELDKSNTLTDDSEILTIHLPLNNYNKNYKEIYCSYMTTSNYEIINELELNVLKLKIKIKSCILSKIIFNHSGLKLF